MKRLVSRIPATLLLSGLFVTTTLAQTSAQEIAANLREQLVEVASQEGGNAGARRTTRRRSETRKY